MLSFFRSAIVLALPVATLLSSAMPLIAQEGQSGIRIPAQEIAAKLKPRTTVPLLIPDFIPMGVEEPIHITFGGNGSGYEMSLDYTADCKGSTYCHLGSITAEKGGQFASKSGAKAYEGVQLRGGLKGLYTEFCGAYCQANLEWKLNGVLYRVQIKNGVYETLIGAANSAIVAGQR
jgi:hypothetical protein